MEKYYLESLIDLKNKQLWEDLKNKHKIVIKESFEPHYIVNFKRNSLGREIITIYVNGYNLCPSSFTHELLHIYIKDKKINIADELEKHITENHILSTIFSLPLRTHIGNCLEHIKMLPIYLNLGFPNEKFLSDYNESKMDSLTILQIKTAYKNYNIYNKEVVDFYIGRFFAMKACNNNSFNYFNYYSELENIDSELFYSLNNFWENWINIIDSRNYKLILEKFIEDLKNWTKNKKFI